jgi:hypothetical protein
MQTIRQETQLQGLKEPLLICKLIRFQYGLRCCNCLSLASRAALRLKATVRIQALPAFHCSTLLQPLAVVSPETQEARSKTQEAPSCFAEEMQLG